MAVSLFVEKLKASRHRKYGDLDIQEFVAMMKEGASDKLPADLAQNLVSYRPETDDELSLWVYVCLEKQGLTCSFTRQPNHLQSDLDGTCSHLEYMCDAFFGRVQDCIVLGNRGSGKTVLFATMLFLEALHKPGIELAHLGAIEDQAKRCYRYFRKMTDHPLFQGCLAKAPTSSRADFTNGSSVEILVGTIAGVNCLHGDMLVDCSRDMTTYPNGVPIRDLVDKEFVVPSVNEETGEVTYRKAKGLYSGKAPCLEIRLARPKLGTLGDELEFTSLVCTPEHPILMCKSHKYRYAKDLTVGDRVQVALGQSYLHKANAKYGTRHRDEYRVCLSSSWKLKRAIKSLHRAIAEAWFGIDALQGMVVHHRDGNRLNNDIENLELMTAKEHHRNHFGDDSQAHITREAILKMSDKHSIKGCLSYLWQDRVWLEAELREKSIAQIAIEQDVHYGTIRKWVAQFNLTGRPSDDVYTVGSARRHMAELRSTPKQFDDLSTTQIQPTILPDLQKMKERHQRVVDRKRLLRKSKTATRMGAWTVTSIGLYQNGIPQDVYDVSVDCGGSDFGHNFPCNGCMVSNSPHPVVAQLDEVELIEWPIMQEAFNMARSSKGYPSATRLTSTRKKATGTMQRLLDEAEERGIKVYRWNLWDTIETCPLHTDKDGVVTDPQQPYSYVDNFGDKKACFVYESCLSCAMLPACRGQAKTSNAGKQAVVTLTDAIKNYKTLDPSVWDAQVICVRPGMDDLIYPMFKPDVHVIDYEALLREKYGPTYKEVFDTALDVFAGQDAGFGCPATVFLQVAEDPDTGEQIVIIFDELYEKNIAPSLYTSDFLIPKHELYNVQEWHCDPSNSAQLMAEMELQGLYTIPGLKNVDEGIDACRALFSLGRLLIDKKCKNLIWELGRYEKLPTGKPKKVDDHLVDAMRFGINGVGIYTQVLEEVYH